MKQSILCLLGILLIAQLSFALPTPNDNNLEESRTAVLNYLENEEAELDLELVETLRENGQASVDWLVEFYSSPTSYDQYIKDQHALKLLDKVSGQKDARFSRLFWHNNLENAKAEAEEGGKAILSLRMLGDFSEDLSCANSRYFRILLYSNPAINNLIRRDFILHVSSVIDVPIITIEYPDGTVQQQTITGNSMHMVLTSEGEILDALPGLYGPSYFHNWLAQYHKAYYPNLIASPLLHQKNLQAYQARLNQAKEIAGAEKFMITNIDDVLDDLTSMRDMKALLAADMAVGKAIVEMPVLKMLTPVEDQQKNLPKEEEDRGLLDEFIQNLNTLGFMYEDVNEGSREIVQLKKAYESNKELDETIDRINRTVSIENIRNELNFHSVILTWLQDDKLRNNDQAFTEKVYKELFLTPLDDKKMGMYNPSLFYGVTDDGF